MTKAVTSSNSSDYNSPEAAKENDYLGEDLSQHQQSLNQHPAPFSARALAAFVDSLMIQALLIPCSTLLPSGEYLFLLTIAICFFYFGIGNSIITSGSTLGKKAFGLSVRHSQSNDFLSIPQSMLRCSFHTVLPLLFIEIPPMLYRSASVEGSPLFLDSPMLLVLCYTIWNFTLPIVSGRGRAGHDFVASSVVMRKGQATVSATSTRKIESYFHPRHFIVSLVVGVLFWSLSVSNRENVTALHRIRYSIEHDLAIRIISIQGSNDALFIQLYLNDEKKSSELEKLANEFCRTISARIEFPNPFTLLRLELFSANASVAEHKFIYPGCHPPVAGNLEQATKQGLTK